MVGGALALLLIATGLPNVRAQRSNNGSSVPAPSGVSGEGGQAAYYNSRTGRPKAPQPEPRVSTPKTLPFLSPDNDLGYPLSYPPTTVVTRSYYVGGEAGAAVSPAVGGLLFGIPAAAFPWNQAGFTDYNEPPVIPRDSSLFTPHKYSLEATPLASGTPVANPQAALLIARLPENALLWVEGELTRLRGPTRYFQSPPLVPGAKYSYVVRAAWVEDGRWVSQTQKVPVRAGLVQAVYLRPR
jgi:uncharacterized protein (TIGR03000 family)